MLLISRSLNFLCYCFEKEKLWTTFTRVFIVGLTSSTFLFKPSNFSKFLNHFDKHFNFISALSIKLKALHRISHTKIFVHQIFVLFVFNLSQSLAPTQFTQISYTLCLTDNSRAFHKHIKSSSIDKQRIHSIKSNFHLHCCAERNFAFTMEIQ